MDSDDYLTARFPDPQKLYPRGSSKCTRCLDPTDPTTLLANDLLCDECANLRDTDPRNYYHQMSHDATQEDAINAMERACQRRRRSHRYHQ